MALGSAPRRLTEKQASLSLLGPNHGHVINLAVVLDIRKQLVAWRFLHIPSYH